MKVESDLQVIEEEIRIWSPNLNTYNFVIRRLVLLQMLSNEKQR